MPPTALGTAAAAKVFAALTLLPSPTVSSIATAWELQVGVTQKTTTRWPLTETDNDLNPPNPASTSIAPIRKLSEVDEGNRPTTLREKVIGELRRWGLFGSNWDGEGAAAPSRQSLKEAVSFVRLIEENDVFPEPMLHASGHAGLFWKDERLYADLEFQGDGRIAYYIECQGDKHKGVLKFNPEKMPALFPTLLWA